MLGVRPSYSTGFAQWPGMSEYPQLWEGLVGAWDASLGQTGSRLIDWSGNGNTGVLVGPTWGSGKFGPDLVFGSNKYVSLGTLANTPSLNVSYITIVCWVKIANQSNWGQLYGNNFDNGAWFSVDADEKLAFYTKSGSAGSDSWTGIGDVLTIGRWYCVVAVFDGNYKYVYVNGVLVGSKALVGAEIGPLVWTTTQDMRIGTSYDLTYDFLGEIDHTSIYNRVLAVGEINLLCHLRKQVA